MAEVLLALDVDNCLMPVNMPARPTTRERLTALADEGAHIVLASGKPCLYLSGLARGLALMDASLIGENGAETWVNSTMPPKTLPTNLLPEERDALAKIRSTVEKLFGDQVFFQPNAIGVTAFPVGPDLKPDEVAAQVSVELPESLLRYIHVDSVDWAVARFDKGFALQRLIDHLSISADRVAALGDSANDLPMFDVAELCLWVGPQDALEGRSAELFDDVDAALDRLMRFVTG